MRNALWRPELKRLFFDSIRGKISYEEIYFSWLFPRDFDFIPTSPSFVFFCFFCWASISYFHGLILSDASNDVITILSFFREIPCGKIIGDLN